VTRCVATWVLWPWCGSTASGHLFHQWFIISYSYMKMGFYKTLHLGR
jgi:hypothetical protein